MATNRLLAAAAVILISLTTAAVPARAEDQPAFGWQTDLDQAATRARAEGKPILLIQGFGAPNEPFC